MRMRVVAVVGIGMLLTGCAATSATPTPSPSPTSITITSPGTRDLTPPAGIRSAHIDIACTGWMVHLEIGVGELHDWGTTCDTPRAFSVPVGGHLELEFDVEGATTFTSTVTFSRAPFLSDATTTAQCGAASTAESDLLSAMNGLGHGQLDATGAAALMHQARMEIADGPFSGEVGSELSTLRTWLDANPAGDPRHAPLGAHISSLCTDNGSPLILQSTYGG